MMLRLFWMFLFVYLLLILQSTVIAEVFPDFLEPDLMLLWVTYLGLITPLFPGVFLVCWGGFLHDAFSGSPFGLFLFLYLGMFLLIKLMGRFIIMGESVRFRTGLVAAVVGFRTLGLALIPWGLGVSSHLFFPPVLSLLASAGVTCGLVWPFFRLGEKMGLIVKESPAQPIP